jgi:hypothetical protein
MLVSKTLLVSRLLIVDFKSKLASDTCFVTSETAELKKFNFR